MSVSNGFENSHFWLTSGLGTVDWNKVFYVNLPMLNDQQRKVALTVSTMYSINPAIVAAFLLIQHKQFNFNHDKDYVLAFSSRLAQDIRNMEDAFEKLDYGLSKRGYQKGSRTAQTLFETLERDETKFQSFLKGGQLVEYCLGF